MLDDVNLLAAEIELSSSMLWYRCRCRYLPMVAATAAGRGCVEVRVLEVGIGEREGVFERRKESKEGKTASEAILPGQGCVSPDQFALPRMARKEADCKNRHVNISGERLRHPCRTWQDIIRPMANHVALDDCYMTFPFTQHLGVAPH